MNTGAAVVITEKKFFKDHLINWWNADIVHPF
jgi:hypothetical protein